MKYVEIKFAKANPPIPVIMSFMNEYRWLSNFQECLIMLNEHGKSVSYPTTENAYMAWKTEDKSFKKMLRSMTAREAKTLSQTNDFKSKHHQNYNDDTRIQTMLDVTRQKYSTNNPELREKLLSTGKTTLVEGTTWNDRFFGFCLKTGTGHNYLGRIIMTVRDEIRIEEGEKVIREEGYSLPSNIK